MLCMDRYCLWARLLFLCGVLLVVGCAKSSPPPTLGKYQMGATHSGVQSSGSAVDGPKTGFWEDYPDVPKLEIMTEIDGIKIPRIAVGKSVERSSEPPPVDVGNEHARKNPGTPVTGDTLTIRFNAEPKVLNPITENSAVMRYIMIYVNDYLFKQDL